MCVRLDITYKATVHATANVIKATLLTRRHPHGLEVLHHSVLRGEQRKELAHHDWGDHDRILRTDGVKVKRKVLLDRRILQRVAFIPIQEVIVIPHTLSLLVDPVNMRLHFFGEHLVLEEDGQGPGAHQTEKLLQLLIRELEYKCCVKASGLKDSSVLLEVGRILEQLRECVSMLDGIKRARLADFRAARPGEHRGERGAE